MYSGRKLTVVDIKGNFGLSTDNFQFVPNGQGGYSVNFTK